MIRRVVWAVCVVFGLAGAAQAEWYVGAGGGYAMPQGFKNVENDAGTQMVNVHTDYGSIATTNGWTANGRVGYWLPSIEDSSIPWNAFGLELQGFTTRTGWPSQTVDTRTATVTETCANPCETPVISSSIANGTQAIKSGHLQLSGAMTNVLMRWPTGPVRPYGEAGLGFASASSSDGGLGQTHQLRFAFNLGAGVEASISERLALTAAYQHLFTAVQFASAASANLTMDLFTAGVVWRFH